MDLLFPRKKEKKYQLYAAYGAAWAGIRRGGRKITIYISVNHSITLLLQSSMSPTCCAWVPTCSRARTSAKVTWICLPPEWDVTLPLFPLFLCFQIFLSHFYELISHIQQRQRLKAQPEAGRRTKSNPSFKKWLCKMMNDGGHKWMEDGGSSVWLLLFVGPFKSL